jgi:coenzyme PQQ precursor peptide PqqA
VHNKLRGPGKPKVLFSGAGASVILALVLPARRGPRPTHHRKGNMPMAWKSPKVVEIALGAEINSYACAEPK